MKTQSTLSAHPDGGRAIRAVIEVQAGSRQKYKYDPGSGFFVLHKTLPIGLSFPYDFGYIPDTMGEDGDPLDIVVFADQPLVVGSLVECRLIGIILATQEEDGKWIRNDRLLGVASASRRYRRCRTFADLDPKALDELERFFETYNAEDGKTFKTRKRAGVRDAWAAFQKGSHGHNS